MLILHIFHFDRKNINNFQDLDSGKAGHVVFQICEKNLYLDWNKGNEKDFFKNCRPRWMQIAREMAQGEHTIISLTYWRGILVRSSFAIVRATCAHRKCNLHASWTKGRFKLTVLQRFSFHSFQDALQISRFGLKTVSLWIYVNHLGIGWLNLEKAP